MKFDFRPLPNSRGPRPVVPFSFATLPRLTLYGLVDSGAWATRINSEWAGALGIDLAGIEPEPFLIANGRYIGRTATVSLALPTYKYEWTAQVSFVDNWNHSHQVLGLNGFFDRFIVRFDAVNTNLKLSPTRRSGATS